MIEFEILARGLYRPDQLTITYDPALRMPLDGPVSVGAQFIAPDLSLNTNKLAAMHGAPTIRAWIDAVWQEKLTLAHQQGFPLFDGQLFRLVSAEAGSDGKLHIVLGNTGYKEYITSREPAFAQGRDRQELGNALAVCSVVETSDGYILYERRQKVAVHSGRFHVIAGFFEQRDTDAQGQPDPFAAMRREIREETGIQASDIVEQYCLGSVYDLSSPHGELCFLTRLNIPLAEVRARTPEDTEIQQLLALPVTPRNLREFILNNHGNISTTGESNLLMYGGLRFGEEWWEEVMGELKA